MMGDDIFDLGVENEALRGKLEVNEKWLIVSKNRIKLTYDDSRKKNKFILDRMKRQLSFID
jgi:hypothetical protein